MSEQMMTLLHSIAARPKESQMTGANNKQGCSFMRECLSKAIQWMIPELIKNAHTEVMEAKLKEEINFQWIDPVPNYGDLSANEKLELLLIDIKNKGFTMMEDCLYQLNSFIPQTVNEVWRLYKQYMNTDFDNVSCVYCKIRCQVDIKHCGRYLHRQGIIDDDLQKRIISSRANVGSQEGLWNELEKECEKYHTPKHVMEAIYSGLDAQDDTYKRLLETIEDYLTQENPQLKCTCQEVCSKMFMPSDYSFQSRGNRHRFGSQEKENISPDLDQSDRAHDQAVLLKKKRRSRSKTLSGMKTEIANKSTGDYTFQDTFVDVANDSYYTKDNSDLESEQSKYSQKRKVDSSAKQTDSSTNIYNFYNKGPVSIGTNVVKIDGSNIAPTDGSESETNADHFARDINRPTLHDYQGKDETNVKRLKYSLPPLAITYSKDNETSQTTTCNTPSSSEDSEYNSSKTKNIPTLSSLRSKRGSASKGRCVSDDRRLFKQTENSQCAGEKTAEGRLTGTKSANILFQRQKSAPCGY